jgi:hypothetical protein
LYFFAICNYLHLADYLTLRNLLSIVVILFRPPPCERASPIGILAARGETPNQMIYSTSQFKRRMAERKLALRQKPKKAMRALEYGGKLRG